MYGSRDSSQLLRLRVLKAVFCFLVLLPVLAVTPAFGQEPVITLAKISYDRWPATTTAVKRNVSAATPLVYMPAPRLQYRMDGLMSEQPDTSVYLSVLLFDQKNIPIRATGPGSFTKHRAPAGGWAAGCTSRPATDSFVSLNPASDKMAWNWSSRVAPTSGPASVFDKSTMVLPVNPAVPGLPGHPGV